MKYDIELAKELKSRNNTNPIGIVEGTVVAINPITISILNGDVIIDSENSYLCKNVTEYTMKVATSNGTGTATHEGLRVGDRVAVLATENNQKFFVIDSLV